jgi:hypothetical protein
MHVAPCAGCVPGTVLGDGYSDGLDIGALPPPQAVQW